jgi:hypothetical protein
VSSELSEQFDFEALKTISKELRSLLNPLEIIFHPSKDYSEFSDILSKIADVLVESSNGKVRKTLGIDEGLIATPALTFCFPKHGHVHYLTIPKGQEYSPFKDYLTKDLEKNSGLSDSLKSNLIAIEKSVKIQVFISSECPNCPNAVRAANALTFFNDKITSTIIDVEQFPKLAKQYNIKSVPMIVIDDGLLINQVIPSAQLAEKIIDRGEQDYKKEHFLSLCSTGNFDKAAQLIWASSIYTDFLYSAWKKSTMSSRMELMLVAQQTLTQNTKIFDKIVPNLISLLSSKDISLKGDTIDLLSQIGHADAIVPIKALLNDTNPDIVEIAEDALDSLDGD